MGLFSVIGGLIGGGKAKKASRKAEAARVAAMDRAIAEQTRQFDLTRQDYAPLLSLLAPSVSRLGDGIGLNGDAKQQAFMEYVQTSPQLLAQIRNGEEAIRANAAATGGLRGGNTQRGLADFRADRYASELDRQLAQLAGAAGLGSGATGAVAAFGADRANNVSNLLTQQGEARANGILTRGGINAQNWSNIGQGFDDALSMIIGGFGGGGRGAAGSSGGMGLPTGFGTIFNR
ncbi:hypothetical protein [Sphingopyxis sp. QXT-31]|uniref:hypothetical protein n=1 Tax=Sphingopyxis sp. QXT-31 TaxID=1357916 RepID=UPI0012EC7DFB|nr:hypothetical protein [Sphingopyxis sp. QXT-31]